MQEPKDGDFVAYVEALQRESAARLARAHGGAANAAFPVPGSPPAAGGVSSAAPAPAPMAGSTQGPVRRDRDAKLVRALLAGAVGLAFLVSWLGDGGPFAFIVGVALLAYGLPRLLSALRALGRPVSHQTVVDHVFGRSATPSKGTRK